MLLNFIIMPLLCSSSRAGTWIPPLTIGLFLKLSSCQIRLQQIDRILDGGCDQKINIAVRFRRHVVVLGKNGAGAIWNPILSQVPGSEFVCHHLKRAGLLGSCSDDAPQAGDLEAFQRLPRRLRNTLPISSPALGCAKVK